MSHRDQHHAPGSVERGNDWLDGALAGWLLFIAIGAGQLVLHDLRDGSGARAVAFEGAPLVLALAAIFPLLRFLKPGWMLAVACLTLMAVREGMSLAQGAPGWRAGAAFLAVHVLGLAYLLWIVPEFWPRPSEADAESAAPPQSAAQPASAATPAASPRSAGTRSPGTQAAAGVSRRATDAAPAGPSPAAQALAAIHHRIVAAGSACAVTPVSVRAEAGRFGVTPAALRTEGLGLYRTFLQHFLADGALSPDEERELICLERALDLDDDGVWRLRAEAGLVGGGGSPAPILSVLDEALPDAVAENDARVPAGRTAPASVDDEAPPVSVAAAVPDPSAKADVTSSGPRIHSPGSPTGPPPAAAEPATAESPALESAGAQSAGAESAGAESAGAGSVESAESAGAGPPDAAFVPAAAGPAATDTLADYEEHELGQLLRWAGIRALPAGAPPRTALERLRALYRTSTEPLESCPSDEPLELGERCLATRAVELFRAGAGAAAAGPGADLPGPLLDPRALVDGTPETELDLSGYQRMGGCRFVLTERRLLLVARSGQQSALAVNRVRAVRPFRNGLQVQPHHGGPVFLAFTDGVDDLAMRIDRAARDLRA